MPMRAAVIAAAPTRKRKWREEKNGHNITSFHPSDITEPAEGALYTAVTGDLSLPDIYGDDVLNLVMFRAYSKDAEFAANAALAMGYMNMVTASLGAEIQATLAVGPKV